MEKFRWFVLIALVTAIIVILCNLFCDVKKNLKKYNKESIDEITWGKITVQSRDVVSVKFPKINIISTDVCGTKEEEGEKLLNVNTCWDAIIFDQ